MKDFIQDLYDNRNLQSFRKRQEKRASQQDSQKKSTLDKHPGTDTVISNPTVHVSLPGKWMKYLELELSLFSTAARNFKLD